MSVTTTRAFVTPFVHRRFSVTEYHQMIQAGILTKDDKVELLNGYIVHKYYRTPQHNYAQHQAFHLVRALEPAGWHVRVPAAITLAESEPEPDLLIARGDVRDYMSRFPGPADTGLVVEVADLSIDRDRLDKASIYAEAGLVEYWIISLFDRRVEVYTAPTGPGPTPQFARRQVYDGGESVPLTLDGAVVGLIAVDELLP